MTIAIGDLIQVQARGNIHQQSTITSWWYRVDGVPGPNDTILNLDALIDYFNASNTPPYLNYVACLSSDWLAGTVTAQQITPVRSVLREKTSVPVNGLRMPQPLTNIASVVSKGTNLAGRSQMGSWHLPPAGADDYDLGQTVAALDVLLGTFGSKCLNVLTLPVLATVLQPVLVHIDPEGVAPPTASPITRTVPRQQARVMRRRTVGVGK